MLGIRRGRGGRGLVAERVVRSHGVVLPTPAFDEQLGFVERVEDLAFEEFVALLLTA